MMLRGFLLISAAVGPTAILAQDRSTATPPQSTPGAGEADGEETISADITVMGQREPGAVPGDVKPDIQLTPADIRSYGVSSIGELLNELQPQTASARGPDGGQPVVLLDGRRISGFNEIRDLPTEAIQRVDILPEEAALRLGYRADQRVVNFVLRRRFNAITGEAQGGGTTEGGRYTAAADANLLRISRDRRFTVNLHYDQADALTEAQRDILPQIPTRALTIDGVVTPESGASEIDPALSALAGRTITVAAVPGGIVGRPALGGFTTAPGIDDVGSFRTIAPATRKGSVNATYSRTILDNVTASVNGGFERTSTDALLGLGSTTYALPATNPSSPFSRGVNVSRYLIEAGGRGRQVDADTANLAFALNGDRGDWRWSANGGFNRITSRTLTEGSIDFTPLAARIAAGDATINPFYRFDPTLIGPFRQDSARSRTDRLTYEFVASGPAASLPAGRIATTIKAGFEANDFSASAVRLGTPSSSSLGRDIASAQVSIDVPLTSRRSGFLSAIGDVSLNGNYAFDRPSDFGTLRTSGYGLNWAPVNAVRLIASVTNEEGPPSVTQLGNPMIVTPDVRVFDFVTGSSVDITRVDGGNRALRANDRRVMKLGLTIRPFDRDLSLTANYTDARTLNPVSSLPAPTAAIEAAFPDRFTRDGSGRLLRLDDRPVNFARRDDEELRWGVNFSKRIGAPPPRPAGGFPRTASGGNDAPRPPEGAAPPRENAPDAFRPGGGDAQQGGGRGSFGGGGGRFGGGAPGGTRVQLSAYHSWHFKDRVLVRPGLPYIDLLNGGGTGNGGGQPRHEVSVDGGITRDWLGLRISGRWQSGSFVTGGTARAPTDLFFAPLTTIQLRAFANLTPNLKLVRDYPWLRGMRVSLTVQNLFDRKLRVTDASGQVPLNYQPDLLDPTGRTVRLGVRKLFF